MNILTHMSTAKDIKEWNLLREEAKGLFSQEDINSLDSSGFVCMVIKVRKRRK